MRSFLVVAAVLSNALTSLAEVHSHAHKMVHAARQRRHVEEQQLDEAEKLRRREIYKRNEQAADEEMATNWMDDGYSNDVYADECLKHHNYHRANHEVCSIITPAWGSSSSSAPLLTPLL